MASLGGTSSGSGSSSLQQISSSEEDMQVQIIDERKRKRMQSNRESARRSRVRKQKHLDDLMTQLSNLEKGNNHLVNSISLTTQQFLKIEAENSILRAQMSELSNRLQSLNDINYVLTSGNNNNNSYQQHHQRFELYGSEDHMGHVDDFNSMIQEAFLNDHNGFLMNHPTCLNHSIMVSANMFQY